jgi:hypothetical protein
MHAAVELVLRPVAHEILIILAQSHLVFLPAVRVVRIRRRAVAPSYPPYLEFERESRFSLRRLMRTTNGSASSKSTLLRIKIAISKSR